MRRSAYGLFLLWSAWAAAGSYVFVDGQGAIHLSPRRLDARYHRICADPISLALERGRAEAPSRFDGLIAEAARAYQLDPRLIQAIVSAESAYNPSAVSSKGAVGLMQLMPQTAQRFGVSQLLDPQQNLLAGARYLHALMAQFNGNLPLVIAAYNAGEGAVQHYGYSVPPFQETRQYVSRVMRHYQSAGAFSTPADPPLPAARGRVLIIRGDQPFQAD